MCCSECVPIFFYSRNIPTSLPQLSKNTGLYCHNITYYDWPGGVGPTCLQGLFVSVLGRDEQIREISRYYSINCRRFVELVTPSADGRPRAWSKRPWPKQTDRLIGLRGCSPLDKFLFGSKTKKI